MNKINIVRWDPFRDMVSLRQAMDRLMEDSFVRPSRALRLMGEEAVPAIHVYQKPEELVVKASLPGLKPEEVDITISGDMLTITGETKADEEVKREDYIYQEHRYGSFTRSLVLPPDLRTDKAEASFDNGVLTLTIPRAEEVKPKTIRVKTQGRDRRREEGDEGEGREVGNPASRLGTADRAGHAPSPSVLPPVAASHAVV